MIEIDRVSKWYGHMRAVAELSATIHPGQVTGLLGPNGAGKTTLIRIITGFLSPTHGRVRVCGHDTLLDSLPARAAIGYLPETVPTYPEMSVEGFLAFRARIFDVPRARRRVSIDRALERTDLRAVRSRRIATLSKGFRQRVGVAAAILHDPRVVILDEPTGGLDPEQITVMRALTRTLASESPDPAMSAALPPPVLAQQPGPQGTPARTVLFSSHTLPEVELTCDRVLIVAQGRLRADGSPAELVRRSAIPSLVVRFAQGTSESPARACIDQAWHAQKTIPPDGPHAPPPISTAATPTGPRFVIDCAALPPAPGAAHATDALAAAITARAAASGLALVELAPQTPTLEQVFLKVITSAGDTVGSSPAAARGGGGT